MGASQDGSPASLVAEVVWTAVTDGTDTLRYTAGDDAAAIVGLRASSTDTEVEAVMKARFGL